MLSNSFPCACVCFGINRCLMRNVSRTVFEEPGIILVHILSLIFQKQRLPNWTYQDLELVTKFTYGWRMIAKAPNASYTRTQNNLTLSLDFLFCLFNTPRMWWGKGQILSKHSQTWQSHNEHTGFICVLQLLSHNNREHAATYVGFHPGWETGIERMEREIFSPNSLERNVRRSSWKTEAH